MILKATIAIVYKLSEIKIKMLPYEIVWRQVIGVTWKNKNSLGCVNFSPLQNLSCKHNCIFLAMPLDLENFLEVKVFHHAPGLRNFFESIFSTMLLDLDRMPLDLEKNFRIRILSLCPWTWKKKLNRNFSTMSLNLAFF